MLMQEVWRALVDAGVELVPIDAQRIEVRSGRHHARLWFHPLTRSLGPYELRHLVGRFQEPGLIVMPAASAEARMLVERAGWSWLVVKSGLVSGVLRVGSEVVTVGNTGPADRSTPGRPGRVPWGSLTITRLLLTQPPMSQRALAARALVTQPRASQALASLVRDGLVKRSGAGWTASDFDRLVRSWLRDYPGPHGISTYWYGLSPPAVQARTAIGLLTRVARSSTMDTPVAAVSGDVAADLIAPWRSPSRAVVYSRTGANLSAADLTPADAETATLELIVPRDPGVWSPAEAVLGEAHRAPPMPVADPLQVLWDVRRAPGADSQEAASRVWTWLRDRHLAHQPTAAR